MAKPVIVTRIGKGSELTFTEGDANFTNLQNATVSVAGDSGTTQALDLNDTLTVAGGVGLSSVMTTDTVTLNLDNTAVTPASYTYANITVDQQGRVTAASSATTPLVSGGALGTPSSGTLTNCTFPTLNQNTTGSAATLTTPRAINGVTFDGSAAITVTAAASTLSGNTLASGVTSSSLTALGTIVTGVWNGSSISTTYTDAKVTSVNGSTGAVTGLQATSEKNQNNGYAGLDAGGKVASAQLPSYVDDVVEAANFAALPVTGETSKIYVALDLNKIYRWSGSAYVEISASPGTTDDVPEGTTNKYFTDTRARGAFSASTGITITSGAVAIANTTVTAGSFSYANITVDAQGRLTAASNGTAPAQTLDDLNDVAITSPSNGQVLKYNSSTTRFENAADAGTTYAISAETATGGVNLRLTGNDSSTDDVKLAQGSNITLTRTDANTITIAGSAGGISDVVSDTTPQLGGNLDVNGQSIVSVSNGNIAITPNGSGEIVLGNTSLSKYKETVFSLTYGATITPDWTNGSVQKVTLTGNATFAAPTNMVAGSSLTFIIVQDATGGRTGTWNGSYKFAGGTPTLTTTANAVDVVNVFYDGSLYLASISKQDNSSTVTGLAINAQGELRLADSDSSNYVGFRSPATVSTNRIWTLPSADGSADQVLKTDGSGNLSFATASGGGPTYALVSATGINFTSGSGPWGTNIYTINWNEEIYDPGNIVTIQTGATGGGVGPAVGGLTLVAGTYMIDVISGAALKADGTSSELLNKTDAIELASAQNSEVNAAGTQGASMTPLIAFFTIATSITLILKISGATATNHYGKTYMKIAKLS